MESPKSTHTQGSQLESPPQDQNLLSGTPTPEPIPLPDAEVILYRGFFNASESEAYFEDLYHNVQWKQEKITLFGKLIPSPRLTAWYGDEGVSYTYSGITLVAHPWTPMLLAIRDKLQRVAGVSFNSVLLNLYRNEQDAVGWHSDDEPTLGRNPVIASVSFGSARTFQLQHKRRKALHAAIALTHGSLLIMQGPTQHHWRHQVPKSRAPCSARINLTFRKINEETALRRARPGSCRP